MQQLTLSSACVRMAGHLKDVHDKTASGDAFAAVGTGVVWSNAVARALLQGG
jgi:hypothetical protein